MGIRGPWGQKDKGQGKVKAKSRHVVIKCTAREGMQINIPVTYCVGMRFEAF